MRLNQYVARATGLSRRVADKAIAQGNVTVNGLLPTSGQQISTGDDVAYSGKKLELKTTTTIMLNKPVGYVCSREGQGNKTIYELLPPALHRLKPIGRLDKNTSGLLLLTDDGPLANELTHPKYQKTKIYLVDLQRALTPHDKAQIEQGVMLEDGISKLDLRKIAPSSGLAFGSSGVVPSHTCSNGSEQRSTVPDNSSTTLLVPTGTTRHLSELSDTATRRSSGHCFKCGEVLVLSDEEVSVDTSPSEKLVLDSKSKSGVVGALGKSSKLQLMGRGKGWVITMQEGRNRQIRRTFSALGYKIIKLHRTNFGNYQLGNLKVANYSVIC